MKVTFRLILVLVALLGMTACRTPVAVDPETGESQTASYQLGTFTGKIEGTPNEVFQRAIVAIDDMGIFRTGELHKDSEIVIYGRMTLDKKLTLRLSNHPDEVGFTAVRIKVGSTGDLAKSQRIFAAIRQ